ncbi:protein NONRESPONDING TO OXYLIPINS 2, mitochondrial-like isoform X1 [Musa acuminata AAA Group]|uniref:protein NONRESPONDING TO OXYLIPINS 2, mitochondrial-like isoform X1 n=1 Tax=Musa acuminata AAA Group TaxID=214697 RepID=UPI0031DF5349
MASLCRSVVVSAARSAAVRSKALLPKHSPPRRASPLVCGLAALASVPIDSLMPLHSAVASARLKSYIAVDSSCWSCLSQGCAALGGVFCG